VIATYLVESDNEWSLALFQQFKRLERLTLETLLQGQPLIMYKEATHSDIDDEDSNVTQ
jgi:hypothetical protein